MSVDDFARFGRLHPLVLHLPIGLLLGALVLEVLAVRGQVTRAALGAYLWFAAGSAVLAAGAGWVLSHEEGYGGATLERHERLGLALTLAALLAALLHDPRGRSGARLGLYRAALAASAVLLLPAGHLGSTLTHGTDWLEGPQGRRQELASSSKAALEARAVEREAGTEEAEPAPARAEPETYATVVAPILATYCTSCHGATKRKGDLRLDSPAGLRAGGESGAVLVPGDLAASALLVRARHPLEHEDHMPPEGKPQPGAEDLAALAAWIASGAPFGAAAGADGTGSTPAPAEATAEPAPPVPTEPEPPAEALAALAAALVNVERCVPDASGLCLDVAAVARTFGDSELVTLLEPLAPFVVELSLARSAVSDAALATVATFPRLRRLDLRATAVSPAGLAALAPLGSLEELNLAQTRLDDAATEALLALAGLRRLFLWDSGLSAQALERLRAVPGLVLVTGDEPAAEVLAAEGELAFSSDRPLPGAELVPEALRPVNSVCPVSGSPVNPKYALVHAGAQGARVIGFCCPNCPKEFWADPGRFEEKLR